MLRLPIGNGIEKERRMTEAPHLAMPNIIMPGWCICPSGHLTTTSLHLWRRSRKCYQEEEAIKMGGGEARIVIRRGNQICGLKRLQFK
jgi:hypothetical protein